MLKSKLQGTTGGKVQGVVVVDVVVVLVFVVVVGPVVVVVGVGVVVGVVVRGPLVGTGGKGGSLSVHGIGRNRLPKGVDTRIFKTSSKVEFCGIFVDTFKEVVIW